MHSLSLKESIYAISIVDIITSDNSSTRLVNLIDKVSKDNSINISNIGEVLCDIDGFIEILKQQKGFGVKLEDELISLISKYDPERLTVTIREIDVLISKLDKDQYFIFSPLLIDYGEIKNNLNSAESIYKLLALIGSISKILPLKNKDFDIVYRRLFGETLESIAKNYGITRERVRQIESKYKPYLISNKEWLELHLTKLVDFNNENKLPNNSEFYSVHPCFQRMIVKECLEIDFKTYWADQRCKSEKFRFYFDKDGVNLTPEGRYEVANYFGLNSEIEFDNFKRWTLDRLLYETKICAERLGTPTKMPMQKDLKSLGEGNLRAAIQRFGGQKKVADLAGLIYQGQIVAASGKRLYWNKSKIKSFLKRVAISEGHPDYMPSQAACKKYADKPSTIISAITRASRSKLPTLNWEEAAKHYGFKYKKH